MLFFHKTQAWLYSVSIWTSGNKKGRICAPAYPAPSPPYLFAVCLEGCTFRLLTLTGIGTSHLYLICMTFAGLIITAGHCIAGDLGRFAWNVIRIAGSVHLPLTETLTAGLICHLRIVSTHMNVILAAGILFIIGTIYNRTI